MNPTRDFLSAVLPWEQSGEGVFFNLHWKRRSDKSPKGYYWDGRAYSSLDDMVRSAAFWGKAPDLDLYVCMSSQDRYEEKNSKDNKPFKKAMRFQANVVGLKSFFIDVDVKPGAYASTAEALEAFRLFIEASDMPMPTCVVASGSGGFHAHWVVERPLTAAEWQPVANALAHAVQHYGLIVDTQCTVDSVRILRVPGSFNQKLSPPAPVTLMSKGQICEYEDIKETLKDFIGLTPVGNPDFAAFPFERRQPTVEGSELSAGIVVFDSQKPTLEDLGKTCAFIQDAVDFGGSDYSNPLWHFTLQAANFVQEGRIAAHLMSNMHQDYDAEETDREFDRVVRNQKERDIGWPSCDKINLAGAPQCKGCPLLAHHKSAFNYVVTQPPTQVVASQVPLGTPHTDIWPEGYTQRPDGLIYFSAPDDQGKVQETKICTYPLSNGWVQDNPWKLHFTCVSSIGKPVKVEVALTDFGGMGGARKVLAAHGMVLNDKEFKPTQDFLMAWTKKLQQQKDSVVSSTSFGWAQNANGEVEGFTYAGRVWCDGYDRPAAQDDAVLYGIYSPHGSAQVWIDAAKLITNQNRPALNAYIGASFGAALQRFTGHEGALVAGYSGGSGVGKSTAMNVAQAVWGHPVKAKQGLSDTTNSLFGKLGRLKAIPAFWDELQSLDQQKKFAKAVFDLTRGHEKNRMKSDLTLHEGGDWHTLLIAASNCSLVEPIAIENKSHNAGLYRLYEFVVDPPLRGSPGQIETGVMTRAIGELSDNYGHAGLIYAQFIGANHKRVKAEISAIHDHLFRTYAAGNNEERFWIVSMTLILAGSRYANELGLTNINVVDLEAFLVKTLDEMRAQVKDSPVDMTNDDSVSTLFAQFRNAMLARHTLTTNRIHVAAGKPAKGAIQVMCDASKLDGIYVQYGVQDKLMRISSTYLHQWLAARELPRQSLTGALEKRFGFKKVNGILGGGTPLATGTKEYLYEIDLTNPKLAGFLEAAE